MVDEKNDHNEPVPEPQKVERTPDKTVGEAKAHELRPEETAEGAPKAESTKKAEAQPVKPSAEQAIKKALSTPSKPPAAAAPKRPALLLAEFDAPGDCMHAAEKLRDAGYSKFDAHTPFPVHGMDKAMGLPDSKLGYIVLCFGLTGTSLAFLMMYWMNGVDYPIIIGGKPPGAIPSMVPILFEVTVLFSALSTVFGMFGLNKLPRHHHPIFVSDRFKSFSDDKFFISVEAEDPKFDTKKTRALLEATHPASIELVLDEEEEES